MIPKILGLHHVTATVDDAQADLDFCVELLGLRLVKKTVNFDNHDVYHFYYGNERGTPGHDLDDVPVQGPRRARRARRARARSSTTSFSVPAAFARLLARPPEGRAACAIADVDPRFGEEVLRFADPSGLMVRAGRQRPRRPRSRGRATASTRRGDPRPAQRDDDSCDRRRRPSTFMTGLLGYRGRRRGRQPHARGGGRRRARPHDRHRATIPMPRRQSTASARCITWRWRSRPTDEQLRLREELLRLGLARDRRARPLYFHVDLLPRAGRRAVRGGDDAARIHGRRDRRRRSGAT